MEAMEINLPGGVAVGEQWYRSAWLRPVTGHVEEFLLHEGGLLPPAARVTHVLKRCLRRLGPMEPVPAELVRQLSAGDREALLLHVRRMTFGERISCLLSCPACGKNMDLDLQIDELLLHPYSFEHRLHATDLTHSGHTYHVVFRLPNGEDQEWAASLAAQSIESAAAAVLGRCVESVTDEHGEKVSDVPDVVLNRLHDVMATLDPQADITLDLTCPECQAGFVAPFDIADYLCRELAANEREFYREVHTLSFHYHWNEDAILALSRRKRRIYLDLLTEEVGGGVSA